MESTIQHAAQDEAENLEKGGKRGRQEQRTLRKAPEARLIGKHEQCTTHPFRPRWGQSHLVGSTVGGSDVAVAQNLQSGFSHNAFCPIGSEDPAFCIWELSEGITAEKFQAYIDSPNGVNIG